MPMDFYARRSLHGSMHDEIQKQQSPIRHNLQSHKEITEQDFYMGSPRPYYGQDNGHESPWTLSPHHQTPSPPLLYDCIASLHRHEGNIYTIAVSKGLVFTGTASRRIRVWKQPDCMDRGYLKASSGEVRAILAFNNMLFSTHKDHKIRIWNFRVLDTFKSKKVATLPKRRSFLSFAGTNNNVKHTAAVSCMAYYHSEGLLYTASHDRMVKAWRISDTKCVDTFFAHEDNINSILVNQDDGCVFTCSSDGSVKIWRRLYAEDDSHSLTMTLKFQPSPVNAMALSLSFNNYFLYSGSSDGVINFWEKERLCYRFNHRGFLQGHHFGVLCLATVGNFIFSGSEDTTIRLWRKEEGSSYHECLAVLYGHRAPVRCLAACLEMEEVVRGFLVYSASFDGTFKVWRVKALGDEKMLSMVDCTYQRNGRMKIMDYDMSPVLSPSWVQKKLQSSSFP